VYKENLLLTLCRSNLNPYCLGRKAAFFFSGHLTLCSQAMIKVIFSVTRFDPRLRLSSFSHTLFCECVCQQV
jgi:hypothetical protein